VINIVYKCQVVIHWDSDMDCLELYDWNTTEIRSRS